MRSVSPEDEFPGVVVNGRVVDWESMVNESRGEKYKYLFVDLIYAMLFFMAGYLVWEFLILHSFSWEFGNTDVLVDRTEIMAGVINGLMLLSSFLVTKYLFHRIKKMLKEIFVSYSRRMFRIYRFGLSTLSNFNGLFWVIGLCVGGMVSLPITEGSKYNWLVVLTGVVEIPLLLTISCLFILIGTVSVAGLLAAIFLIFQGIFRYLRKKFS